MAVAVCVVLTLIARVLMALPTQLQTPIFQGLPSSVTPPTLKSRASDNSSKLIIYQPPADEFPPLNGNEIIAWTEKSRGPRRNRIVIMYYTPASPLGAMVTAVTIKPPPPPPPPPPVVTTVKLLAPPPPPPMLTTAKPPPPPPPPTVVTTVKPPAPPPPPPVTLPAPVTTKPPTPLVVVPPTTVKPPAPPAPVTTVKPPAPPAPPPPPVTTPKPPAPPPLVTLAPTTSKPLISSKPPEPKPTSTTKSTFRSTRRPRPNTDYPEYEELNDREEDDRALVTSWEPNTNTADTPDMSVLNASSIGSPEFTTPSALNVSKTPLKLIDQGLSIDPESTPSAYIDVPSHDPVSERIT